MLSRIAITLLFTGIMSVTGVWAQNPITADTVKVIEDASSVTVIKDASGVTVRVKGINGASEEGYEFRTFKNSIDPMNVDWNIDMPFLKKKRVPREEPISSCLFFKGMFVGGISPVDAPEGMLTSWEWGVPYLFGYSYSLARYAPEFMIGVGAAFRWYNVGKGYGLQRVGDELLLIPVTAEQTNASSRFTTSSVTVSAGLKQRLAGSFMLALSATLDFNFHTTGFYRYYDGSKEGARRKIDISHLHQRVMRWDFMASLGFESVIAAYVRYSPVELFAPGYGPRFRQMAAGIQLFF